MTVSRSLLSGLVGAGLSASLGAGCSPPPVTTAPSSGPVVAQPDAPKRPPAPRSSSRSRKRDIEHEAALLTMINSSFGYRTDKDHQARFPLPDRKNWLRVRFTMIEHFAGFIYGEKEHSLAVAVVQPLREGDAATSANCVQRFEEHARKLVSEMAGQLGPTATEMRRWQKLPLVVRTATGEIDLFFKHHQAALAWTGYPAYPGHCMVYAIVIPYRDERDLAFALRDRWLDAFKKFKPLTDAPPFRHPSK